jgi:CDGSH-type Zn-finger protein/uncharacterized Fe-S cluster protein YjdI
MKSKIRVYESDSVIVQYDVARCIHAQECVHGLPEVFDPNRNPWIDPTRAGADKLAEVIGRCPTGALGLVRKDGAAVQSAAQAAVFTVAPDGPLYARGNIEVTSADGRVLLADTRVALCRCGQSENKPLCDGSHARVGFKDPGQIKPPQPVTGATAMPGGKVTVKAQANGPLRVSGAFTLVAGDGSSCPVEAAAFCRCGHSRNKPFCDGSHKAVGFSAA